MTATRVQRYQTAEKYVSNSTIKGIVSATVIACTHLSEDRCEQTTSDMSITVRRDTMKEISIRIARLVAAVGTIASTGDRDSIITDAAEL